MTDKEEINKQLGDLEQRRQLIKRQREECEKQLEQIDTELAELKENQDQRVKEITDPDSRDSF